MTTQATSTEDSPTPLTTIELSVVLPCLNEAETLATCIDRVHGACANSSIDYEVVVADNGSTDGSIDIAEEHGARVVHVPVRGYGAALTAGIESAHGTLVIMADADDSYALENLQPFVDELRNGADVVVGNRFAGGIEPGAMPWLHRWIGNPVLSFIGRRLFRIDIGDFHCGMRGFRRQALIDLDLSTTGMEYATEMIAKAALANLDIREVPTTLRPDGRSRQPHLRTWRDGWRHLRFMMLMSPRWLFGIPGIVLTVIGLLGMAVLLPGAVDLGPIELDVHALVYAHLAVIIGFQLIVVGVLMRLYAVRSGLLPPTMSGERIQRAFGSDRGVVIGVVLIVGGVAGSVIAVANWGSQDFGGLDPSDTMRIVIPSVTAVAVGAQALLGSLALGVIGLDRR
ncbi:MAG: glycosyltransferase family 2 protein [Actinomycetota bacterium]